VYVVAHPARGAGAELYESDTRSPQRVARTLELPADGDYRGIAVHCAAGRIFLSDAADGAIWVINRNHFSIQWRIAFEGSVPGALAVSPRGDVLYILAADGQTLWAVDPHSTRVLGQLRDLRSGRSGARHLTDGSRLHVWPGTERQAACVVARLVPAVRPEGARVFAVDALGNCRLAVA